MGTRHSTRTSALLTGVFLCLGTTTVAADPVAQTDATTVENVDFERHIMGLLSRQGCNAGSCHGSFQGKGGFYLSLFGYSAEKDHQSLTRDGFGRRINRADPDRSLLLLKATGQVPHGGGRRFAVDSSPYRMFLSWIKAGAQWQPESGKVERVVVTPDDHQFAKPGEEVQLVVTAEFANGDKADVTSLSTFRTGDDYVASVTPEGAVSALRAGDAPIVISYRGNVVSTRVLIPAEVSKNFKYPKVPEVNYVDREVFSKLRKLNIVPSDLSNDTEFLRRLYIDTIATLPTPDEVRAFAANKDPNKRTKKIDEMLKHPMHAALWATKFSDITGNDVNRMENPRQIQSKRSKMWHDWFRTRVEKNVPYDQIVEGVLTATSRDGQDTKKWAEAEVAMLKKANTSFDSNYHERDSLDLFWRRRTFTIQEMAEHTATAFLGVRIECAQCHKHPFDRWTVTDYRAYANLFSQVTLGTPTESRKLYADLNKKLAKDKKFRIRMTEVYVNYGRTRPLAHPETNGKLNPQPLGGESIDIDALSKAKKDAREELFEWMTRSDNPYFARSFVNRVWAHYFGVGIVDPVDDFAVANPPSNAKLLDELAKDFIASKFDIRKLERTILLSRAYQLSATPNETNKYDKRNYSRGFVRRMMAEAMVDVLNAALGTKENFGKDVPSGIRAIEVAPNRVQSNTLNYVFTIFGRPPRGTTCDCERPSEPALPQTLFLMTDTALMSKITNGRLKGLLSDKKQSDEQVLEELFLASLSRWPSDSEKAYAKKVIEERGDRRAAFVDLTWALINTREFILNH